jgi:hypothetical protein
MEQRQMIPFERKDSSQHLAEDEILDNEVMPLSDEEEDDNEDSEIEEEDEGGIGVRAGDDLSSDFEDGNEEQEEDVGDQWGKRKRTYYSTDYVDSEIVSSDEEGISWVRLCPGISYLSCDFSERGRGGGVIDAKEEAKGAK